MMDINPEQFLLTLFIASVRASAALLVAPLLPAKAMPVPLRIILALAIGLIAQSHISLPSVTIGIIGLAMIAGEIIMGLALGFVLQLCYASVLIAGEIIAASIGLGFAAQMDPISGTHAPTIGTLLSMVALALYVAANGHLLLITAIIDSYAIYAPGGGLAVDRLADQLIPLGSGLFISAVAIALPVGVAALLAQLAMALVSRAVPQLNLFAIGLTATVMVGLVALALLLPVAAATIGDMWQDGFASMNALIGR